MSARDEVTAALIEQFRKAMLLEHADDWTMDACAEAAHVCARAITDDIAELARWRALGTHEEVAREVERAARSDQLGPRSNEWRRSKNLSTDPFKVATKLMEEIGEVARALVGEEEHREGRGDVVQEAAQSVIVLASLLDITHPEANLLEAVEAEMNRLNASPRAVGDVGAAAPCSCRRRDGSEEAPDEPDRDCPVHGEPAACSCSPCTTPAYGAPGYAHCAACCYGTLIAEYNPDCPIEEHRELARRQLGIRAADTGETP